jgi:hypothetical protein
VHDNELHPQAGRRFLHLAQLVFGTRIFGLMNTAMIVALGTISCSSPSRFASSPSEN